MVSITREVISRNVDPGLDEPGRHPVRMGGCIRVTEISGVGRQCHVKAFRDEPVQGHFGRVKQVDDDLSGRRVAGRDEMHGAVALVGNVMIHDGDRRIGGNRRGYGPDPFEGVRVGDQHQVEGSFDAVGRDDIAGSREPVVYAGDGIVKARRDRFNAE